MITFELTSFTHIKDLTNSALKSRSSDRSFMADITGNTFMY